MVGRISSVLDIKKRWNMDEIDSFWFLDLFELCALPLPRQTLQWRIALSQLHEAGTLSELYAHRRIVHMDLGRHHE
jgi:hypothetical protein